LLEQRLKKATSDRHLFVRQALWQGYSVEKLNALTAFDPWFLNEFKLIVDMEKELEKATAKKGAFVQKAPGGFVAPRQVVRFLRCPVGFLVRGQGNRLPQVPQGPKGAAGLPHGGHLRGRVRGFHAVPVFHLRGVPFLVLRQERRL
jgi:hypothetical protein